MRVLSIVMVVVSFFIIVSFVKFESEPFTFFKGSMNKWTIISNPGTDLRKLEFESPDENEFYHFWNNQLYLIGKRSGDQVTSIKILNKESFEASFLKEKEIYHQYGSDIFLTYCASCHLENELTSFFIENETDKIALKFLYKGKHFKNADYFFGENDIGIEEVKLIRLYLKSIQ